MTRVLKGFLFGYRVVGSNGAILGKVISCLLHLEHSAIILVKILIHGQEVTMPFAKCIVDHEKKLLRITS